jgi:hypothetical protein
MFLPTVGRTPTNYILNNKKQPCTQWAPSMALDNADKKAHNKVTTTNEDFDYLLLESIDEAFSTLGESPKTAIYYHLEHKFGIPRRTIPRRIEEFSDALEKVFGLGAKHLEIIIMKNRHCKTLGTSPSGKAWNSSALTFSAYILFQKQLFNQRMPRR